MSASTALGPNHCSGTHLLDDPRPGVWQVAVNGRRSCLRAAFGGGCEAAAVKESPERGCHGEEALGARLPPASSEQRGTIASIVHIIQHRVCGVMGRHAARVHKPGHGGSSRKGNFGRASGVPQQLCTIMSCRSRSLIPNLSGWLRPTSCHACVQASVLQVRLPQVAHGDAACGFRPPTCAAAA